MEERGGVLVQNEKQANKSVAKVMRITFLIFSIVFLLNVFGIFVVDMKIMAIAYILGSILLWVPTIIVNIAKSDGVYIKYAKAVEDLFDGLKIWENQMYHQLQGTYPVIFLSLAGIKEETYESAFRSLCFEIR